jgi:hypothetical protein
MSDDPAFAKRVVRLARTSSVALGYLTFLWAVTVDSSVLVGISLLLGWLLMPTILWLSLGRPRLRYALVIPSSLVGVGLLAICILAPPTDSAARLGWILATAGVLLGGVLGFWFWFRWAPVPAWLDHPFSTGRWLLVSIHVALIIAGLALITLSTL